MLILEGADCSGKTTLANMIALKFGAPFCHLGLPPEGKRHWEAVRSALKANPLNTVYDRMILGSLIFGSVKPDKYNANPVTEAEFSRWCALMNVQKMNALIVLCVADEDTLMQRFRARGDAYLTEAELETSAVAYRNLIHRIMREKLLRNVIVYASHLTTPEVFLQNNERAFWQAMRDRALPNNEQLHEIRRYMD